MSQFQQYPQQPQPAPPAPRKPRRWLPWAAGAGAFLLGIVIGSAGGGGSATPSPTTTVTVTAPAEPAAEKTTEPTTPAAPKYGKPTKADFKLTPKILSKQCFGSAGCNLTYRILISYTGPDLDPSVTYEVLYEVRGGEDGPVMNKLSATGGTSSVDEEEIISTKSSKTKLTAVVTDVLAP